MAQRKPKKPKKPVKTNKLEPVVNPRTKAARQVESRAQHGKPPEPTKTSEEPANAAIEATAPESVGFPVVVLGASAGGLAALEPFFEHLPRDSGMAFVVVTHQSPDHTSLLPELLARYAGMETKSITPMNSWARSRPASWSWMRINAS